MYIEEIERQFVEAGETEADIEAAKAYATNLLNLGLPVIFDKEHFAKLQGRDVAEISKMSAVIEQYYTQISIPKKAGGYRELNIPNPNVRLIQKWILNRILYNIPVSEYAHGFCKGKSIKTNAELHINQECVINLDLKDFFPSITQNQVFRVFYYYGYTQQVSHLLSRICTYEGHLPQGAVTSPYLSNIVSLKLDKRISGLADKFNAKYSRYADDITISGNKKIKAMLPIIEKIIEEEGFEINSAKTRIQYKYRAQEVTGLTVNAGKVNVDRRYIKKLMQEIYYCKKFGPSGHLAHVGIDKLNFKEHMYGKAYFVKMVNEDLGKKILDELAEINWER